MYIRYVENILRKNCQLTDSILPISEVLLRKAQNPIKSKIKINLPNEEADVIQEFEEDEIKFQEELEIKRKFDKEETKRIEKLAKKAEEKSGKKSKKDVPKMVEVESE